MSEEQYQELIKDYELLKEKVDFVINRIKQRRIIKENLIKMNSIDNPEMEMSWVIERGYISNKFIKETLGLDS